LSYLTMVVGLLFYRRARLPQNFFEVENLCVVSYLDDPPTSSFLKGTTRFVVRAGLEPDTVLDGLDNLTDLGPSLITPT
jgi:hypothetical protein